jgi:hypothetical protein
VLATPCPEYRLCVHLPGYEGTFHVPS